MSFSISLSLPLSFSFLSRPVFLFLISITLLRLAAIWFTPLGPDVEETQYWLWSQTPDAGYFTKPPMIAWVIGLTTSLFGDGVFGIKFAAPIIQLLLALLLGQVAQIFGGRQAGYIASLIWITIPGAVLGGYIISTDSPMLLFMAASMVMLAPLAKGETLTSRSSILAGIFSGLAMMSKYAALYLPAGLVLWWLWEGRRRMRLSPLPVLLFLSGMMISLAPNIIWNLMNGFVTVGHLEHNADLGSQEYSLLRSLGFLAGQAGIAGPILLMVTLLAIMKTFRDKTMRFWLALAVPALAVITVQAYLSNANINWAAASWPPLVVITSVWLAANWQGRRRLLGQIAIGTNALIAGLFVIVTISGSFGPLTPASDPLRRLRGWDDHTAALVAMIDRTDATAIVTERRGHAAKFSWLLRELDVSVEMVDANAVPENHFEASHPWQPVEGRRIIVINGEPEISDHFMLGGEIDVIGPPTATTVKISTKRTRQLYFHPGIER